MVSEPVNVNEWQELARQVLRKKLYEFYAGGAENEFTLRENVEAFRRITFRPRVLVDVSKIDMSTYLFGHNISAPILIAPSAYHVGAHPAGEVATARAAAACNIIMTLAFTSSRSLEEVAASCNAVRFFQLYIFKDREITVELVQRAEKSGYKALVLTVDRPIAGRRESDNKNKLNLPPLKNLEGLKSIKVESGKNWNLRAFARKSVDDSLNWQFIGWLKSITKLPVLIKGVLTHEDATKAVEVGVDGIIVSNHGARQLDYSPATISVLEEVVHAVGRKVPVLIDGGIRRGTDVFKALALGAQAVLIGRPVIFGLAVKGEDGVSSVIEMLKHELELTMALCGCPSLASITRNHVETHRQRLRSLL